MSVGIARDRGQGVDGQSESVRLQSLLQPRLGIFQQMAAGRLDIRGPRMRCTTPAAESNPESRKYRAQNGLQGIRQESEARRNPPDSGSPCHSRKMLSQTQLLSNLRQGLAVDERRPQPRQCPLVSHRGWRRTAAARRCN